MVNDEAISSRDIERRIQLVLASTGLSNTEETLARLRPQILQQAIDETIQRQEVGKAGIQVTAEDVGAGLATLEQQRGLPAGALEDGLRARGAEIPLFLEQLKTQIGWNKLILRKLRPLIKVSEAEIDRSRSVVGGAGAVSEVRISLLSLAVDRPEREPEVKALADKFAVEIKQGANFESIAQQFSAQQGVQNIEAFWVPLGQIEPAIAEALKTTKPGSITEPVRTAEGYSLIKLYELRRQSGEENQPIDLRLKDILLKLKPGASEEEAALMLKIGQQIAASPG